MDFHGIEMKGKFIGQKVSTKPAWASGDEARIIYAEDTEKIYIGQNSDWALLTNYTEQRSKFTYNGGVTPYTVKALSAMYMCKDKLCEWATELTTNAIGTPAAGDFYYLYLDYSAITCGTAITATELIWSNTEPAWNDTYRGLYNGNNKCIFAVLINASPNNIVEFFHDGDYVLYSDQIIDRVGGDLNNVYEDVTLTIPSFATKAVFTFYGQASGDADLASLLWKTKDQSGTVGHLGYYINAATAYYAVNSCNVITNSSQVIEVKHTVAGSHHMTGLTEGWYFPNGM